MGTFSMQGACNRLPAAAAGWGPLGGCDLAIIEEVVEHLDPGPLQAFPAAVLGGLRPRAAVVTTPNIQYNAVLKRLSGSVLPTGLRNSDHRFEWWALLLSTGCHSGSNARRGTCNGGTVRSRLCPCGCAVPCMSSSFAIAMVSRIECGCTSRSADCEIVPGQKVPQGIWPVFSLW